jgi:hypothetical protein
VYRQRRTEVEREENAAEKISPVKGEEPPEWRLLMDRMWSGEFAAG